ncbi:MAG: transposase [Geminicoccaceae bacterium]
MGCNQLRLWLSGFAYTLIKALQRIALAGTTFENASPQRIRLSLLKIAAQVTLSPGKIDSPKNGIKPPSSRRKSKIKSAPEALC